MKQYKVGILGATGAVGREMMKILLERKFPISELHLYASERSAGKVVAWNSGPIQIELAEEGAFEGLDLVLGAASGEVAKQFAPDIVKAGAVFSVPRIRYMLLSKSNAESNCVTVTFRAKLSPYITYW